VIGLTARRASVFVVALVVVVSAKRATSRDTERVQGVAYDLVILHGRVMDPASGLDAVRNVGVRAGRIASLTSGAIAGRDTIDAHGLVVAPGFIDLHQHAQDSVAYRVEAAGGITTALELESGTADVDGWYAARAGKAMINYGVSAGHERVRMVVLPDSGRAVPSGDAAHRAATEAEVAEIERRLTIGLRRGAVAVGLLLGDTPGASTAEVAAVFRVAAREHASVHVHLRPVATDDDTSDIEEVLSDARATGAALHVVHLPSTAQNLTPRYLAMMAAARGRGRDVTTEAYPYTTGMAEIDGALYDGWEQKPDAWFTRKEWPATGERLTRETFARYRAQGGYVVAHPADETAAESWVRSALASPFAVIATDGILDHGVGHPRVAGTYARVLGRYVREGHALTLMAALRKMTLLPARRLERRVPSMRRKGRLAIGADADIVVFDPERIVDRATYREPTLPPDGVPFVVVNGTVVVRGGRAVEGVMPGRAVRAPISDLAAHAHEPEVPNGRVSPALYNAPLPLISRYLFTTAAVIACGDTSSTFTPARRIRSSTA